MKRVRVGMTGIGELKRALAVSLWFMLLTFPIMVVRVNPLEKSIEWRWANLALVGAGSFVLTLLGRFHLQRREGGDPGRLAAAAGRLREGLSRRKGLLPSALWLLAALAALFPFIFSPYQVGIMTTALTYVVLGLGLNIVVGLAGLLDLGYVAFYAVGAYSYALLNYHYGVGFWVALPIGALLGALFGLLLGFPVLRLRGDYLAIVTLGFGEIIRIVLQNWNEFSFGPSGIANIPRPAFFGLAFDLGDSNRFLYFLMLAFAAFTVFVVNRLRSSRIGRAWIALREDEIACQAMGIDKTKTKLTAFAIGATWAGMMGVVFAAKTTFVDPSSFTFIESAMILSSIVVLGGMGSIIGVVIAALLLILLPEYLRVFADYRMLIFGAILVAVMVFRPQGISGGARSRYRFRVPGEPGAGGGGSMRKVFEVVSLTMDFGGLRALDSLDLHVGEGEIVALIGPNGAGKTTFFNCVSGFCRPRRGDVSISPPGAERERINNCKPNQVTEKGLARTFQNIRLFADMTALENVMVGRHCRSSAGVLGAILRIPSVVREERSVVRESYAILKKVGLGGYVNDLAGSLPYGAQRRLEIARAMATGPFLLLLDEPAAGMNPAETRDLDNLIVRLRDEEGISILLIEHDMRLVMSISDRVVVLDYGRKIADGVPAVVGRDPDVIKAYLGEDHA